MNGCVACNWRFCGARSLVEALTATLYVGSLAVLHLSGGHWAAIILLAFALVRAFIVFHDAAHSSFFDKTLGQVLQFFINYSLDEWNTVHNSHHAHFGPLIEKTEAWQRVFEDGYCGCITPNDVSLFVPRVNMRSCVVRAQWR